MPAVVDIQSHSQAALEKMLAEQLRQLLGRIAWLSGVQVAANVIQPLSIDNDS
jgi:hypothetical protein